MPDRYTSSKVRSTLTGKKYLTNVLYPDIPVSDRDTYVITTAGDRYDLLASNFYGDIRLWWIIASANTSTRENLSIAPGTQLRIPADPQKIVNDFETFNENR